MLALFTLRASAEALGAYRDARRVLLDELGLDPSPQLRALERAILRHEAGLPARMPSRAGRREIVCLAAEIRATDRAGPLDPEVLGDVMKQCHAAAEAVASVHGDPLRELRGDGMVAVFGTPVAHEDDARRAADTAAALMARLTGVGDPRARARHRARRSRRRDRGHGVDSGGRAARCTPVRRGGYGGRPPRARCRAQAGSRWTTERARCLARSELRSPRTLRL